VTILEGRLLDEPEGDEGTVAVTSHLLLNSLSIIVGSAATIRHRMDDLDPEVTTAMLRRIERQGRMIAGFVEDMARGLPPDLNVLLAEMGRAQPPQTW
jgi:hypothetical protein